jgi:F-type H+-transporting ATPase subunit delta
VIPSGLSRRYAKALLAIGIDSGTYEQIGEQLDQVASLWHEHPDLRPTLQNPSHPLERRREVLRQLASRLSLSDTVRNFLLLLLDRQRIEIVGAVASDYAAACDEHAGRVRAEIVSARVLDPTSLQQLRTALQQKTGKDVVISVAVDPQLIAGAVSRIGSIVYDGSLETRLAQLRDAMISGRT